MTKCLVDLNNYKINDVQRYNKYIVLSSIHGQYILLLILPLYILYRFIIKMLFIV